MYNTFQSIILAIASFIISIFVEIIYILTNIAISIHLFFSQRNRDSFIKHKISKAIARDRLWNSKLGAFLNVIFKDDFMYKFGKYNDTISQACGYNIVVGNKNKAFVVFYKAIDWLFKTFLNEEDHCLNSTLKNKVK